ncbi:YdeI/OmpD-associated family protein [Pengzhenrongella frigida]|uniref:YdeI/OmpD-associated family protein n=1 Tax=Pengzhenrongella frigida TaxID=1259133 RepID=A0A4Q5MZ10_9MICO|nr:YdeI/OmpD-associated family protein [Cellulomonas sp. HLT2-17]RYV50929.1 hypothetical protein EUA98_11115 [Cellulomonas sp. HLT2-17]
MVTVAREQVEPEDRSGWRQWLAEHGGTSPGVWLVIRRKGAGPGGCTLDEAVEEALCAGWIDSTLRRLDDRRSVILFAPRRPTGTWSRVNRDRVVRLRERGLMTEAGERAVQRAQENGSWTVLDDIDALLVPPDLAAALDAAPTARAGFDGWSDSLRKQYLWWVATARRATTRERRIGEIVQLAADGAAPGPTGSAGSPGSAGPPGSAESPDARR